MKTVSIHMDQTSYAFVNQLAEQESEDVSKALCHLLELGRIMFALEKYSSKKVSLSKAAKLAGVSISSMIEILSKFGVESSLELEDYKKSLENIRKVW